MLHAIALTETGRWQAGRLRPWPWAANLEGKGHWFASRDEALAFARRSLAAGRRSFDIGCFQINYHWHVHQFPALEAMADPAAGAAYAARLLRELYEEFGSWSEAAGAYHSRTPEHAQRYRARFDQILAGLDRRLADGPTATRPAAPAQAAAPAAGWQVSGPRIITIKPGRPSEEPATMGREASLDRLIVGRSPTQVATPEPFDVSSRSAAR